MVDITTCLGKRRDFSVGDFEITDSWLEQEDSLFQTYVRKTPPGNHQQLINRMQYVRAYCLLQPGFDGYGYFISQEAIGHCYARERRLKATRLSEEEFYSFDIMQDSIEKLGLCPEATFEFILYLWYHLLEWERKGVRRNMEEKITKLVERIEEHPDDRLSMHIKVGKKHYKFENENFVKTAIYLIQNSDLEALNLTEKFIHNKREHEYILIQTLFRNLPIEQKNAKKCTLSQTEITFALCVLWLIGRANRKDNDNNPGLYCDYQNNGIVTKLIKDYKGSKIPHITSTILG